MSLVGGYAIGGGTGMMTIVHIGIMNDTGRTEQMNIVSKQRIERKPSGQELRQGWKTHTWPIDSSPSIAYLDPVSPN